VPLPARGRRGRAGLVGPGAGARGPPGQRGRRELRECGGASGMKVPSLGWTRAWNNAWAGLVAGEEWRAAARALVEKYSGDQPEEAKAKAMDGCDKAYMVAIDIDHMAGKEAIEFVNARKQG